MSSYNCLVSLELKDTLTREYKKQSEIIEHLNYKLNSNYWSKEDLGDYNLEIIPVEFDLPLDTNEKMNNFVRPYYKSGCHFSFLCGKTNNFLIRLSTLKEEKLVDGIYESLKKACTQFSKQKAGIIACHIEGIYPGDWIMLKDEGGLYNMTKHLLFKEETKYIHSVIYSSNPGSILDNKIYEVSVPTLSFKNPNTIFYNNLDTKILINI